MEFNMTARRIPPRNQLLVRNYVNESFESFPNSWIGKKRQSNISIACGKVEAIAKPKSFV